MCARIHYFGVWNGRADLGKRLGEGCTPQLNIVVIQGAKLLYILL